MGGIDIDLNITPDIDVVGGEEEGDSNHWDEEVDSDGDPELDDVPDDIDDEDVNNDGNIDASSVGEQMRFSSIQKVGLTHRITLSNLPIVKLSGRSKHAEHDEANSRVHTSEHVTSSNIPIPPTQEQELKNMFFGFMNQWFNEFMQERNQAQQPPPHTVPFVEPPIAPPPPPVIESSKRTLIEKLRKCGTEEFRGRLDDDPVKVEY
ncbi:rRNA biogenesis protein rrp36-like [Gossypium hirsutum]|uniref:rRNA biogenesis protein rrp36-like n=1 Tax=Gossypium hirsutum TaxID=3635 RepID=A0A1U8P8A4_GOSHI|nr:rRNA biogenesis protein rrp36-like [Gossypium hirsutum]